MEELYTIKEVSKLLKCSINRVHDLRKSGVLKCLKLGNYKVTQSSLNEFLSRYDGMDITDPNNIKEIK
jgi:hypothetical protein